jgi:hypothetical protein
MARLSRLHNPRSFRLFVGTQTTNNTPGDTETLNASKAFLPFTGSVSPGQFSIFLDVGAGLTGSFLVQGTNVPDPELSNNGDWVNLNPTVLGSLTFAGSAATVGVLATDQLWEWIRLNYTHTSGSATFRAHVITSGN